MSCESGCPNPASPFRSPFPILVAMGAAEPRGDGDRGSLCPHPPQMRSLTLASTFLPAELRDGAVGMSWESPVGHDPELTRCHGYSDAMRTQCKAVLGWTSQTGRTGDTKSWRKSPGRSLGDPNFCQEGDRYTHSVPRDGNLVSQNFILKNWLLPSWGTVADATLAERWEGCTVPSGLGSDEMDFWDGAEEEHLCCWDRNAQVLCWSSQDFPSFTC